MRRRRNSYGFSKSPLRAVLEMLLQEGGDPLTVAHAAGEVSAAVIHSLQQPQFLVPSGSVVQPDSIFWGAGSIEQPVDEQGSAGGYLRGFPQGVYLCGVIRQQALGQG